MHKEGNRLRFLCPLVSLLEMVDVHVDFSLHFVTSPLAVKDITFKFGLLLLEEPLQTEKIC